MCKNTIADSHCKGMLNVGWDCSNELVAQHGVLLEYCSTCWYMELFGGNTSVLLASLEGNLHVCNEGSSQIVTTPKQVLSLWVTTFGD